MDLPNAERLLASAARFLVDGREKDAALVLVSCSAEISWKYPEDNSEMVVITLSGPRAAYDALTEGSIYGSVFRAFKAVLPRALFLNEDDVEIRAELVDPDPDWRIQIADIAQRKSVHNQAIPIGDAPIFPWKNLRFRSETERRIAMAFDLTGVLFFPNCMGRLSTDDGRANREPDFLVCDNGKWGILEIDGTAYHKTAAVDHARDRVFRSYRIRVIERYQATECREDAPGVVKRFLAEIARNG